MINKIWNYLVLNDNLESGKTAIYNCASGLAQTKEQYVNK